MTAEKLLNKLKKDSNQRTQKTLDSIYTVCLEQVKKGNDDFSFSTISRLGEHLNVPKPQSIRNKSGEKYRVLIDFFKNQTKGKPKKTDEYDWVKRIPDSSSRILVNQLIAENKKLNKQLNEAIPPDTLITIQDNKSQIDNDINFTELEKRAIEYLLSDSFKSKNILTEDNYGRYLDDLGEVFLPTATTHAMKKILSIIG
ncbi:gamma-mobile-trio protein GmtX [Marinomonas sp.]